MLMILKNDHGCYVDDHVVDKQHVDDSDLGQ